MMASAAIREKIQQASETGRVKVQHFEAEANRLVQRLVEKSREAQAECKRRLETFKSPISKVAPVVERVRHLDLQSLDVRGRVLAWRSSVEGAVGGRVEKVLGGLGIASRAELEKLQKRFDSISERLGDLARAQKKAAREARAGGSTEPRRNPGRKAR